MTERDWEFGEFIEEMGEATTHRPVPQSSVEAYRGRLPDKLLEYWENEGWNGYADGLFWLVNPDDYDSLVANWVSETQYEQFGPYRAFARTAFGDFYVWSEPQQRKLTIDGYSHGLVCIDKELRTKNDAPDISMSTAFALFEKADFDRKDQNGKPLFQRALKRLGPLAENEVYGFEPALIAGGQMKLDNLRKLDLFIHLDILRKLGGPPSIPFAGVSVDTD